MYRKGHEVRFSILHSYDIRSDGRSDGTLYPVTHRRQYLWFNTDVFCVGIADYKIILGGRYRKLVSQYNGLIFCGTRGCGY